MGLFEAIHMTFRGGELAGFAALVLMAYLIAFLVIGSILYAIYQCINNIQANQANQANSDDEYELIRVRKIR